MTADPSSARPPQALRFNRQRSILTTISLAWGVACFVILYSYGDGFHLALRVAFQQVGQDLVLMFGGQTSNQAGGERAGRRIRLERADVEAIRDTVPMVAAISPEMMMGGMTVTRGYRTETMMVRAVETAYGRIRNQTMAVGPLARAGRRIAEAARGRAGRGGGGEAVRRDPAGWRRDRHQRPALHA